MDTLGDRVAILVFTDGLEALTTFGDGVGLAALVVLSEAKDTATTVFVEGLDVLIVPVVGLDALTVRAA